MICPFSNCTLARTPSQSSFSSLHSPRKKTATNLKKHISWWQLSIQRWFLKGLIILHKFLSAKSAYEENWLISAFMRKLTRGPRSKLTPVGFREKTYSWSSIKLLRISSVTSSTTADAWFLRSKWIIWNVDLTSFLIHYNVFATCWVSGSLWQYQDIGGKKTCLEIKGYPN